MLDIFPEIIYQSTIAGDEVGESWNNVESIAFHIIDTFVMLDN